VRIIVVGALLGVLAAGARAAGGGADSHSAAGDRIQDLGVAGPFTCRVTLPAGEAGRAEPLLSVGFGGRGDVILVYYHEDGRVSFGWEQTGHGVEFSDPITVSRDEPHQLTVALGSLWPAGKGPGSLSPAEEAALRAMVMVQFDGRTVLAGRGDFGAAGPGRAAVGANLVGGDVADAFFHGRIEEVAPVDPHEVLTAVSVLGNFLAPPPAKESRAPDQGPAGKYPGPVLIRLRLPPGRGGQSEPLVATGRTGAGDLLYLHYDNDHQVRFGFDHWLVGGPISNPITVNPDQTQEVVISLGSMLPPPGPGASDAYAPLRHRCLVFLNGQLALNCTSNFYPTLPAQILIASNAIGASTAEPKFTGTIIHAENIRPEDLPSVSP